MKTPALVPIDISSSKPGDVFNPILISTFGVDRHFILGFLTILENRGSKKIGIFKNLQGRDIFSSIGSELYEGYNYYSIEGDLLEVEPYNENIKVGDLLISPLSNGYLYKVTDISTKKGSKYRRIRTISSSGSEFSDFRPKGMIIIRSNVEEYMKLAKIETPALVPLDISSAQSGDVFSPIVLTGTDGETSAIGTLTILSTDGDKKKATFKTLEGKDIWYSKGMELWDGYVYYSIEGKVIKINSTGSNVQVGDILFSDESFSYTWKVTDKESYMRGKRKMWKISGECSLGGNFYDIDLKYKLIVRHEIEEYMKLASSDYKIVNYKELNPGDLLLLSDEVVKLTEKINEEEWECVELLFDPHIFGRKTSLIVKDSEFLVYLGDLEKLTYAAELKVGDIARFVKLYYRETTDNKYSLSDESEVISVDEDALETSNKETFNSNTIAIRTKEEYMKLSQISLPNPPFQEVNPAELEKGDIVLKVNDPITSDEYPCALIKIVGNFDPLSRSPVPGLEYNQIGRGSILSSYDYLGENVYYKFYRLSEEAVRNFDVTEIKPNSYLLKGPRSSTFRIYRIKENRVYNEEIVVEDLTKAIKPNFEAFSYNQIHSGNSTYIPGPIEYMKLATEELPNGCERVIVDRISGFYKIKINDLILNYSTVERVTDILQLVSDNKLQLKTIVVKASEAFRSDVGSDDERNYEVGDEVIKFTGNLGDIEDLWNIEPGKKVFGIIRPRRRNPSIRIRADIYEPIDKAVSSIGYQNVKLEDETLVEIASSSLCIIVTKLYMKLSEKTPTDTFKVGGRTVLSSSVLTAFSNLPGTILALDPANDAAVVRLDQEVLMPFGPLLSGNLRALAALYPEAGIDPVKDMSRVGRVKMDFLMPYSDQYMKQSEEELPNDFKYVYFDTVKVGDVIFYDCSYLGRVTSLGEIETDYNSIRVYMRSILSTGYYEDNVNFFIFKGRRFIAYTGNLSNFKFIEELNVGDSGKTILSKGTNSYEHYLGNFEKIGNPYRSELDNGDQYYERAVVYVGDDKYMKQSSIDNLPIKLEEIDLKFERIRISLGSIEPCFLVEPDLGIMVGVLYHVTYDFQEPKYFTFQRLDGSDYLRESPIDYYKFYSYEGNIFQPSSKNISVGDFLIPCRGSAGVIRVTDVKDGLLIDGVETWNNESAEVTNRKTDSYIVIKSEEYMKQAKEDIPILRPTTFLEKRNQIYNSGDWANERICVLKDKSEYAIGRIENISMNFSEPNRFDLKCLERYGNLPILINSPVKPYEIYDLVGSIIESDKAMIGDYLIPKKYFDRILTITSIVSPGVFNGAVDSKKYAIIRPDTYMKQAHEIGDKYDDGVIIDIQEPEDEEVKGKHLTIKVDKDREYTLFVPKKKASLKDISDSLMRKFARLS